MVEYTEKLLQFIKENDIDAELVHSEALVDHKDNVLEAIKNMNIKFEDIVKTIIFYDQDKPLVEGNAVVAIVPAESRVDRLKVKKLCGSRIKIAGAEDVLKLTGYPAGGVPPFGFKAKWYIDKSLIDKKGTIYAGGGSLNKLLKTRVSEIVKINTPVIEDIIEKIES